MRGSEEILETLLDNLNEGIHIVDEQGKTIYYNSSMEKIEGVKSEKVIGKRVSEISSIDDTASTLMNSIKYKKEFTDIVQKYSVYYGKEVTTINTTVPVFRDNNIIAAIEISKDMTQLKELSQKLTTLEKHSSSKSKGYCFHDIITKNPDMLRLIERGKKAASSKASVLISGETGSGKELFAQSIHYDGLRSSRPFIAINCAAIPSELLEGMLFGTLKGSFTGAENKEGLFLQAKGGTLFLDEINSMDINLQAKLLRALQEGYIRPIGSAKEIEVDVRVIACINEEPEKLISDGKLRKDLYYRLCVVRINVIPLRERKEDIPLLVDSFIAQYNKAFGREIKGMESSALLMLQKHDFPGNVRELKNIIESACIMSEDKELLALTGIKGDTPVPFLKSDCSSAQQLSLQEHLKEIEKEIILKALKKHENNISKASKELGLSRQNLQYKLKKLT